MVVPEVGPQSVWPDNSCVGLGMKAGENAVVFRQIRRESHPQLFQVGTTGRLLRLVLSSLDGGNAESREQADDRDRHQQFHQGKTILSIS